MSKRRSFVLFVFALGIAAAASWMANNWLLQRMQPAADAATLGVVTAAKEIPSNEKVLLQDLKIVQMPPNLIPQGAIRDVNQIVGKVTTQSLFPGELLFSARFKDAPDQISIKQEIGRVLTPETRAMAINVDSVVGMGTFLRPGSRVDIMAARDTKLEGANSTYQSTRSFNQRNGAKAFAAIETIVQDVKVLSVDQASIPEEGSALMKVRAVTLEVSPYQAEILAGAMERWRLIVTLRPVQS